VVDNGYLVTRAAELREAEEYGEAISLLREAVSAGDPDAPELLALCLLETAENAAAVGVLGAAVRSGRADLAGFLGDVAAEVGDVELAEQAYRTAIGADVAGALNDCGTFLSEQGRYDEAVAVFSRAVDAGDDLAPGNLVLLYLEDLEDEVTAAELGERYLDERRPTTVRALAAVRARTGDLDAADALYRRAVELGAPHAHVERGWFLRDHRHDPVGAEREFRLAWDEAREAGAGYQLGLFLHEAGRDGEAGDVLREAAGWGDLAAAELWAEISGAGAGSEGG
jgi:Tfp pilus assembly protein PilF